MENFGSEVGQKMRSAVKAKLLELGTGGSTGYIDDELPDYVMIMVANKRPKEQMIQELNLFLAEQTELFVTWLHEVLQKLQEVTLPAATVAASARKRKNSEPAEKMGKKDKKSNRKDRKSKTVDENAAGASAAKQASIVLPKISSITDVFAEDLLEKAKKNMEVETETAAQVKKGKGGGKKSQNEPSANAKTADSAKNDKETDAQANTTTEISSTTGGSASLSGNREKDLAELAEIQQKIYEAKKHLKQAGELEFESESDDDYLQLRSDESSNEEVYQASDTKPQPARQKSPIVFESEPKKLTPSNATSTSKSRQFTPPPQQQTELPASTTSSLSRTAARSNSLERAKRTKQRSQERERDRARDHEGERERDHERERERDHERERERDHDRERERDHDHERARGHPRRQSPATVAPKRLPVHARLGKRLSPAKNESSQRSRERAPLREKEIYVPRHRRSSPETRAASTNSSAEQRNRERHKISQSDKSSPTDRKRTASAEAPTVASTQRLGSRVLVAAPKIVLDSDDEELNEKPVNSVIKITPRPNMSPRRAAPKNLLLRAVAEAQRSTIQAKSAVQSTDMKKSIRKRLGVKVHVEDDDAAIAAAKRPKELYTSRYLRRQRSHLQEPTDARKVSKKKHLIVQLKADISDEEDEKSHRQTVERMRVTKQFELSDDEHNAVAVDVEEEYVPKMLAEQHSDSSYVYVPQSLGDEAAEEQSIVWNPHNLQVDENTKFVVTMNDEKTSAKYSARAAKHSRSKSPQPQVSSSSSAMRANDNEATSTTARNFRSRSRSSRRGTAQNVKSRLAAPRLASNDARARIKSATLRRRRSASRSNTPVRRQRSVTRSITPVRRQRSATRSVSPARRRDAHTPEPNNKPKHSSNNNKNAERSSRSDRKQRSISNSNGNVRKSSTSRHDERSTTPPLPVNLKRAAKENRTLSSGNSKHAESETAKHTTGSPTKRKACTSDEHNEQSTAPKRRSKSDERAATPDGQQHVHELEHNSSGEAEEKRKIQIRPTEARKYDNIPELNAIAVVAAASAHLRINKPKEKCKYHPNCTKTFCDFYHPTAMCNAFPNCKFGQDCLYSHPQCRYDLACTNLECNYAHSGARNPSLLVPQAPPLSSHVVPVQNYKSISVAPSAATLMCKYYPTCSKVGCTFYHPKPCRFGNNCINKLECSFYHHDMQSSNKFKWIASAI